MTMLYVLYNYNGMLLTALKPSSSARIEASITGTTQKEITHVGLLYTKE